jgi:hypothetical protein
MNPYSFLLERTHPCPLKSNGKVSLNGLARHFRFETVSRKWFLMSSDSIVPQSRSFLDLNYVSEIGVVENHLRQTFEFVDIYRRRRTRLSSSWATTKLVTSHSWSRQQLQVSWNQTFSKTTLPLWPSPKNDGSEGKSFEIELSLPSHHIKIRSRYDLDFPRMRFKPYSSYKNNVLIVGLAPVLKFKILNNEKRRLWNSFYSFPKFLPVCTSTLKTKIRGCNKREKHFRS